MKRHQLIAVSAAGAVVAAAALAVPALAAGDGPGPGTRTVPGPSATSSTAGGWGPGGRSDQGMGGRGLAGMGGRGGSGMGGSGMGGPGGSGMGGPGGAGMEGTDCLSGLTKGTLTSAQAKALAGLAEEEKLAHDVYVALASATGDARFTRIVTAETRHLTTVRALLTRYGITDPTAGKGDGQFASAEVASQYRDLVARGKTSLDAALAVGRDVENDDLKVLSAAGAGVGAQDVSTVYSRLASASRMHLRAFGG